MRLLLLVVDDLVLPLMELMQQWKLTLVQKDALIALL